jgi:hypothetical protein
MSEDKRIQIDQLPLLTLIEALQRANILHTKDTGNTTNSITTVGDILDLAMMAPPNVDVVDGTNELLSLNASGENVIITVQDILNLTNTDFTPTFENMHPNDHVMFADESDSFKAKRVDIAEFQSYLDLTVGTGSPNLANGNYRVGSPPPGVGVEFRWGAAESQNDFEEAFPFATPFPNACHAVYLQVNLANASSALSLGNPATTTQFFVDRNSGINGFIPFFYFAVGY